MAGQVVDDGGVVGEFEQVHHGCLSSVRGMGGERNLDWPGIGLGVWEGSGRYTEAAEIRPLWANPRPEVSEELATKPAAALRTVGCRGVAKDNVCP